MLLRICIFHACPYIICICLVRRYSFTPLYHPTKYGHPHESKACSIDFVGGPGPTHDDLYVIANWFGAIRLKVPEGELSSKMEAYFIRSQHLIHTRGVIKDDVQRVPWETNTRIGVDDESLPLDIDHTYNACLYRDKVMASYKSDAADQNEDYLRAPMQEAMVMRGVHDALRSTLGTQETWLFRISHTAVCGCAVLT